MSKNLADGFLHVVDDLNEFSPAVHKIGSGEKIQSIIESTFPINTVKY